VADLESGLLGRTLLTLVSNKGYIAGSKAAAQPELPPHKFSPHDIVAVKPNKGPGNGPPLCTGKQWAHEVEGCEKQGVSWQPRRADALIRSYWAQPT
jgi:hypothetical protein